MHIFGMWAGHNPMNANRRRGWESFGLTGLHPILITPDNLEEWVVGREPLHPAYPFLSLLHRVDYLRAYFMFHHGGGYADIKPQTGDWTAVVEQVANSSRFIAAGYREIRGGTPLIDRFLVQDRPFVLGRPSSMFRAQLIALGMRAARPLMMGNGAYWFKPRTPFARNWLDAIHERLDILHPLLIKNPAREIREYVGGPSGYPVPWTFMHGDVVSYLSMLNIGRILLKLPRPQFTDYF
jgi:hypothetical protein